MLATLLALGVLHAAPRIPAAVDTMVDVGGYRVHARIHRGTLPVTILMEAGGGATLARWNGVDSVIAQRTGATVVAYERAGFGTSELGPLDLDPVTQARQIAGALERLRVPSRRVLVGTSYGGLMAVVHADLYRDRVTGIVLVDPMSSRFVDATGEFVQSTVPHITSPRNDGERATARLVNTFKDILGPARDAEAGLRVPMVVISATRSVWNRDAEDRAWRASHEAIVAAAPGRRLVVAENSGHDVARDRPDTIVDAVVSLVAR